MTDPTPTPTRAEVEALAASLNRRGDMVPSRGYMHEAAGLLRALAAENQALRERAEAAEAERDRQYDENVNRIAMQARAENERDVARRAEDKAFNEALEKAIGIARRCGAFATARDIRKLIRTVEE